MPGLKTPPKPKWRGTPPKLVAKFVEFARAHGAEVLAARRNDLAASVLDHERDKQYYLNDSGVERDAIARYRQNIAELRAALVPLDDLSRFDEGLIDLLDHPNLLGIRPDSRGCLVAHTRVFRPAREDEVPAYLGDFEIGLRFLADPTYGVLSIEVSQTDPHCSNHWSGSFRRATHEDSVSRGRLYYTRGDLRRKMMAEGDFTGLLDDFATLISQSGGHRAGCQSTGPEAPAWTGIAPNLEAMLARTIDISINRPTNGKIVTATKALERSQSAAVTRAKRIREASRRLSETRAQLAQVETALQNNEFDEGNAREQLRYITSLPGVMGVRFERYRGFDVPVLHVRASTLYGSRRYDIGDFEIVLRETHNTESVVPVNRTRASNSRGTMYYHPEQSWRGSRYNWFCFGRRGSELQSMFRAGQYGQFVQVALNTLCSINTYDQDRILDYYPEIPLDTTWRPLSETIRQRPRRRLRDLVGSHLV